MKIFFLLALMTTFSSSAFADLAPGPEDPCYQIKDGGKCTTDAGGPGTCVQSCQDRLDPSTGKKMYTSCHTYCRAVHNAPNDELSSDKNKAAPAPKTPTN